MLSSLSVPTNAGVLILQWFSTFCDIRTMKAVALTGKNNFVMADRVIKYK